MLDTGDRSLRTPASHRGGDVLAGAVLRTPVRGGGTVTARSAVRPEIQALRAIAVLTVVAYHLWPRAIPGGFVGVDVFLAISGFLITSLLVREIERTGTLSLGGRTTSTAIGLVMLTFLAAWLTKLLVEDPVRTGRFLVRRRAHWTFGFAGAATALVLALTLTGTARVQAMIRADERTTERTLAAHPACFGAAARDPHKRCENPALRLTVVPTPAEAAQRPKRALPVGAHGARRHRLHVRRHLEAGDRRRRADRGQSRRALARRARPRRAGSGMAGVLDEQERLPADARDAQAGQRGRAGAVRALEP